MPSSRKTVLRPPGFAYLEANDVSRLHCEKISLTKLAEQFGTPQYVYSSEALRTRFTVLDKAFKKIPHIVCYSIKANSNLSILKLLAGLGAGFDVVSGGELERVLHVNKRTAAKVVFS